MPDSTELIWESVSKRLRTFIARRVNNEADVDDILQDVFLRIHQRLATVKRADREYESQNSACQSCEV